MGLQIGSQPRVEDGMNRPQQKNPSVSLAHTRRAFDGRRASGSTWSAACARVRAGLVAVALGGLAALSGCGSTDFTGEKGQATFTASGCGGLLSDIGGCDLKKGVAVGGVVDVAAKSSKSGLALALRSDIPAILTVQPSDRGGSAIVGQGSGTAYLSAVDSNATEVDRLAVKVVEIAQLVYNTASTGFGTFRLQPVGDVDGTFDLNDGVSKFTLLFLQVDAGGQPLLGRDSFTAELSPGLSYQAGREAPRSLQFELARPSTAGSYFLTVRAKTGPGRFKLQINVK
jgi:hypothetical protein